MNLEQFLKFLPILWVPRNEFSEVMRDMIIEDPLSISSGQSFELDEIYSVEWEVLRLGRRDHENLYSKRAIL